MKFVSGNQLGTILCEMLSIDPDLITAITVECVIGSPATITVSRYIEHREIISRHNAYFLLNPLTESKTPQ